MKVDFYVDVCHGMSFDYACAYTKPGGVLPGAKRVRITADIPDELVRGKVDATVEAVVAVEEPTDDNS